MTADSPGWQLPGSMTGIDSSGRARLGVHVLADIIDVFDPACFTTEFLIDAFGAALREAGATIRQFVVEEFSPDGLSILVVLAESHASLHTWPERHTILLDVFTCGPMAPLPVVELFAARLSSSRVHVEMIDRGARRTSQVAGRVPGC